MFRWKLSTGLLFITILLLLVLFNQRNTYSKLPEGLIEKIKKAKSFDDIFKLEKTIRLEATKNSFLSHIKQIIINANGDILINNENGVNSVLIFDKNGKFKKMLANKGNGPGEIRYASSIASDLDGNIYVLEPGKRSITMFDSKYSSTLR